MPAHSPSLVTHDSPPRAAARVGAAQWRAIAFALSALALAWLATAAPGGRDVERMQAAARRLGPQAEAGLHALEVALDAASVLDDEGKLEAVNRVFNLRIRFREDIEVWGEIDYWASPLETLAKGEGDCEDFAIAKYFSLLTLGVPSSRLRLVYVRARIAGAPAGGQAHMVLAYYASPAAEPVILDNLIADVLPASRRGDLTPVFSFNSEGLWQGVGAQTAGNPLKRLSRWRDVVARARAQGFP